ncbi:MAG TPA: siroheme synthase CysG [Steroidobacteraceae bacterium]|nr:siroheme synthase CysG [Steroidobacteraceae bacterium]
MDYLPIFVRLSDSTAVVVGGGAVAARKAELLLASRARVTIIAPELGTAAQLLLASSSGRLHHLAAEFTAAHLQGAALVIAATDSPHANAAVAQAAGARQLPVNVVDDPQRSSFIFPAIVDRSPVILAVGTEGRAPVLARRLREQLEALLPARLGALARFAGSHRRTVQQALRASERRSFWERLFAGPFSLQVLRGDERAAEAAFARELAATRHADEACDRLGEVYLIGAGPGDPDLLTLRALQLLQSADVILYDRLVSGGVLERARREALRVCVGKAPEGDHGAQHHIHELLATYARQGLKVARLKGGDPFIFGRGGEELEFLEREGIPCTVVPGITAGLAAAATAALPLTHRHLAGSVTFVAGHSARDDGLDWAALARPRHTVVFYMSVSSMSQIVHRLLAAGAPAGRPAAVVERATLPGERVLRGCLAEIAGLARAERIVSPALLIVGDVSAVRAHSLPGTAEQALQGVA